MAPCSLPLVNMNFNVPMQSYTNNWQNTKEICDGCPPAALRGCLPPIQPCCVPVRGCNTYEEPAAERCRLPLVNIGNRNGQQCGSHPRDDCCRIPMCTPCLPKCPLGTYVERVHAVKPNVDYEPPHVPFEGCSTYRTHYNGCMGMRASSFKPSSSFDPSRAKMADISRYREDYTCKPIIPVERFQNKSEYVPSCAPLEGVSTYRVDFKGCYGSRAESSKPQSTAEFSSGKMDGITTYRTSYIPYCPLEYQYAKADSVKTTESDMFSCSPFDGCTTYRVDFVPKCSSRTPSMKPRNQAGFSSAKFGGCTTYKNDYLPFHFDKCPGPCIPEDCCVYDPCC